TPRAAPPSTCPRHRSPSAGAATSTPSRAWRASTRRWCGASATASSWTPPRFDDPGLGRLVLIQPWEFGSIPRDWLEPLASVDEVWVPSAYVRAMYVGDGVPADR